MISTRFGIGQFSCVCGFALWVGASALAKDADGPQLRDNGGQTNQTAMARPLGPVSSDEAKMALRKIKPAVIQSGTWRRIDVFDDTTQVHTNIVYQWHGPDGKPLERSEEIQQPIGKGPARAFLLLRNEEGLWKLHERVAILYPQAPARSARGASGTASSGVNATNATTGSGETNQPGELMFEEDPEIAADLAITGERIKEGDRVALRVSKRMGPKAQRRMEFLFEQKIKEMKKEIPLVLRPLATVSMIKTIMEKMLPARSDVLIDDETNSLISVQGYAKDGRFIMEERAWAPWPDLPPESYAVPKNLKLLRPRTTKEADQLEEDARKEDEKLREKKR